MVKLYVEGGGDAASLRSSCREGFATFLKKAGLAGQMPRIVACGSRRDAYDSFCTAISNNETAFLLVDSEAPIDAKHQQGEPLSWKPWLHLQQREGDEWEMPANAQDTDCHFMAQCMESWLLADKEVLENFFGQGFKSAKLPKVAQSVESIAKVSIYDALKQATHACKSKSSYGKGEHSFKLLSLVDPAKVISASPWAKRFIETIKTHGAQS